jgi:hemerythrin-like domain-containing protein
MPELMDTLRQEHGNIASLLLVLEAQIKEFEAGHRPDYDVVSAALDYFETFPDLYHHPKEDLVFAKLRARDPASAEAIGDLAHEHRGLRARVKQFADTLRAVLGEAELPRADFVRRARQFIDAQWQHLHMEEERFFPAADKMLTAADWAELKAQAGEVADPLFGAPHGDEFEQLRQAILKWQAQYELTTAAGRPASHVRNDAAGAGSRVVNIAQDGA